MKVFTHTHKKYIKSTIKHLEAVMRIFKVNVLVWHENYVAMSIAFKFSFKKICILLYLIIEMK